VTQLRYVSVIYYSIFREKRGSRPRLCGCSSLDVALTPACLPALLETGCSAKALQPATTRLALVRPHRSTMTCAVNYRETIV
jgi:hypothetical protein